MSNSDAPAGTRTRFILGLKHPRTGEEMLFEAPWPEDFTHLVNVLRSENAAYSFLHQYEGVSSPISLRAMPDV
jgi:hypothetical protein